MFASRAPDADAADYTSRRIRQGCASVRCVGRWAQIDPFVLHGPPQALDEDVVVAAPASIHADLDPVIPQHLGKLVAGELRALIGIEDAGLAEPAEGLAQRLDAEPGRERIRQPPGAEESGVERYRELLALVKDKSVVLEEYATRLVSAEAVHLREMELMLMKRAPD